MESNVKTIVEYLKNNLKAGESYERGDVYLKIGNAETLGSETFEWDDTFWELVEKQLTALLDK